VQRLAVVRSRALVEAAERLLGQVFGQRPIAGEASEMAVDSLSF
jgi:hypothetical protein